MRKSHIVLLALLATVTLGISACSHVADDWKAAQKADTTEAYQDFLRQHPDSEYGVPAQERVKQLAENRDWQQASTTDTLDAYQQFVATHADGKWAQEARIRIENFQLNGGGRAPATLAGAAPGVSADATGPVAAPATSPAAAAPAAPAASPKAGAVVRPASPAVATPAAKPGNALPKPAAHKSAPPAAMSGGKHRVQLGAYSSRASAEAAWRKIEGRFPTTLKPLKPDYVAANSHGKSVVRLQLALPSAERAHEVCAALKKKSQACVAAP